MAYEKGQTGNPKGRPKTVYWDATNVETELANAAAKEGKVAYSLLIKAMKANEPWAFQVFFSELMPKTDLTETFLLEIDQDNPNKIDAILDGLLNAISQIKEVTIQEACELIKALSSLKLAQKKSSVVTNEVSTTSDTCLVMPNSKEEIQYAAA